MTENYQGTIDKILYRNDENAWSVAILNTGERTIKANGIMPGLREGMTARITGSLEQTKWGITLKATEFEEILPDDTEGIEKYLGSGLVKFIGPKIAHEIVCTFGRATLAILDNEPERLNEVYGVGKKRIEAIIKAAKEHRAMRDIWIWLKKYDIPNGLGAKIYAQYGDQSIRILEEDPYRLYEDIGGVGFKKADQVACLLGIRGNDLNRVTSGIRACLEDAASEGNTCMPAETLVRKAAGPDYLSVKEEDVAENITAVAYLENGYAYLHRYIIAENDIAGSIARLKARPLLEPEEPDIEAISRRTGTDYSDEQRHAIRMALTEPVSVITGGPGTGKTVTTNAIISEWTERDGKVLLAAPTGRAAKRMEEVTGQKAKTIHRLLEFSREGFQRNEDYPLEGDALIVDEASMIDTMLMRHLLAAVPDGMKVVLVGDVDQLPSVGAGCVLRDIIDSGSVPVTRLTVIYRQAQDSRIITNAHLVNAGYLPRTDNAPGTDFWFFRVADRDKVAETIRDLVSTKVPAKFGYRAEDIQVLSPMRKESDPIGATMLNKLLQDVINPGGLPICTRGALTFKAGDRIMQTKNDYDKGLFNGDIGTIVSRMDESDEDSTLILADFDGQIVRLSRADVQNLDLAYASTIHKSQGSEYPVVIIPMHESQYIILQRNLLYTGITRARKQCIIVGTEKAIAMACRNEDTRRRCTRLKEKLSEI